MGGPEEILVGVFCLLTQSACDGFCCTQQPEATDAWFQQNIAQGRVFGSPNHMSPKWIDLYLCFSFGC